MRPLGCAEKLGRLPPGIATDRTGLTCYSLSPADKHEAWTAFCKRLLGRRKEHPMGKRMVEPILVSVVTFRARFSFPVSWRPCPCHPVSPAIPVRNSTGAT
jgi:hypothetical protein